MQKWGLEAVEIPYVQMSSVVDTIYEVELGQFTQQIKLVFLVETNGIFVVVYDMQVNLQQLL